MSLGPWITNLESRETVENQGLIHVNGWSRTMAEIRSRYGDVVFGPPQATKYRTAAAISADGIIGIYMNPEGGLNAHR